ncbi:serine hydrolase [Alteripontixanthobacter muriae]|uniref:serine hydrolase n=1 Tax=Alteripontixanthobacter muriae TaxID=2705546 RepID=UPI00157506E6|nr:serine hydrolase [Alteripontixanthobacter muriae]
MQIILTAALLLPACAAEDSSETRMAEGRERTKAIDRTPEQEVSSTEALSRIEDPSPRPAESEAEERLDDELDRLADDFDGEVGIAVRDLARGWTAHHRGDEFFPQQSVSKLWVAVAALDLVDRGKLDLSKEVTLGKEDLTLFYQPVRTLILRSDGYTTTLGDLLERAIMRSDNTANDFLLREIGGPDVVRKILAEKNMGGIRFGPGERKLQSRIAGLDWKQEYSIKSGFHDARGEVPVETREQAFESYLKNPIDGAIPVGIADALARLQKGELLSPASTDLLLSILSRTRSGPRRLKGGLAPGWSIAHKTGTGQVFEGAQAGYNDVGLVTSPDGRHYSVAVTIGRTSRPIPQRMQLMQNTVQAVINYDQRAERQ